MPPVNSTADYEVLKSIVRVYTKDSCSEIAEALVENGVSTPAMKAAIAAELSKALRSLGAKSDLLSIVGSYGDTLNDSDVLAGLMAWNTHSSSSRTATSDNEPQRH